MSVYLMSKNTSMNFGFPTRFLKKLDIYQQIRSGQGISKHKKLWRYEAAFLKTAYKTAHQHLNSSIEFERFNKWIEQSEPSYDKGRGEEIFGNLFWRSYADITDPNTGNSLLNKSEVAHDNKDLAHWVGYEKNEQDIRRAKEKGDIEEVKKLKDYAKAQKNNKIRPTQQGLLIGEVLSEIESPNFILRWWNKYRYSLTIDMFWLLVFIGAFKVLSPHSIQEKFSNVMESVGINISCLVIGNGASIAILIFVVWPILNFMYRELYLAVEKRD